MALFKFRSHFLTLDPMGFKQNELTLNQCESLSPANAMRTCELMKEKKNQFRLNTYTHTQIQKRAVFVSREILTHQARNNLQWMKIVILSKHCKSHYAISPITLLSCTLLMYSTDVLYWCTLFMCFTLLYFTFTNYV